jgi:sugar (pentulose or hexulose) kinase
MTFVLGIDKGTSVIKAAVFGADARARSRARRRVEVLCPRPGWHEEDPRQTWSACAETIRRALDEAGVTGADIAAIGIAGHMGGAWLVDAGGEPVRNAICWPDSRARADLVALARDGGADRVFAVAGNGLMPGITAMLLGWLAKHEPDALARTATVLCAKDFLRLKLTGEVATDPSDVSFMPGDIDARAYSDEVFELCGAAGWLGKLPPILASGAIAGTVTAQAAAETGLRAGTPVVTGLGDACANALGVGAVTSGAAFSVLGTSCLNSLVLAEPNRAPAGLGFLFAMPLGNYLRILPNTSGTVTGDWFREQFGGSKTADGHWDFAAMEARAAAIPAGADGVILLPYVSGAGVLAPFADTQMRGVFFGVSTHSTRDHLLRAVYESLCFATRDCFDAMPGRPDRLTLTGGGARSEFWARMFADVCGMTVEVSAVDESGALGVALLAAVAAGVFPDLVTAAREAAGRTAIFHPEPEARARYDDWFGLYRNLRDTYRRFSDRRADLARPVPVSADRVTA